MVVLGMVVLGMVILGLIVLGLVQVPFQLNLGEQFLLLYIQSPQ